MEKIFQYNEVVIWAAEVLRVMPEFIKRFVSKIMLNNFNSDNTVVVTSDHILENIMVFKTTSSTLLMTLFNDVWMKKNSEKQERLRSKHQ